MHEQVDFIDGRQPPCARFQSGSCALDRDAVVESGRSGRITGNAFAVDVDEPQTADQVRVGLAITKQRAVGCGILQQMFSEQIIPVGWIGGDQFRVGLFRKGAFPNYGAASGFDSCGIASVGRIVLQEFFGITARKRRINAVVAADIFG